MMKLLDLVSQLKFCISTLLCANSQSSCWTWLFFFVFTEKNDRKDLVAGLGLQIEILYFEISVLK